VEIYGGKWYIKVKYEEISKKNIFTSSIGVVMDISTLKIITRDSIIN
jgi:hypothetical protein